MYSMLAPSPTPTDFPPPVVNPTSWAREIFTEMGLPARDGVKNTRVSGGTIGGF